MKITKSQIIASFIFITEFIGLLLILILNNELSFYQMAALSILQVLYNEFILRYFCKINIVSLPSIFLVLSFFFHCGQIIKLAFNIDGSVPLPFENYASMDVIRDAFFFYSFAQAMYVLGISLHIKKYDENRQYFNINKKEVFNYGVFLLIVGIGPRFYIDVISMLGAMARGYEGVYSIYFPQFLQTLAFFFDAGLIFMLFASKGHSREHRLVFLLAILYKGIMMMSGSRQYNVVFLLVWIYLYAYILHKITIKKQMIVLVSAFLGFIFISIVGMVRSDNMLNLTDVSSFFNHFNFETVFGNALGEYGSAFTTLLVAVNYTPDTMSFGLGKSYIAGILSSIPLLLAQIPTLKDASMFVSQLPKSITFALGGSYLGEFYYNFSWFGIIPCIWLGILITEIEDILVKDSNIIKKCFYAAFSVLLILFIRGYFTDMMQKIIWIYVALYFIRLYKKGKVKI